MTRLENSTSMKHFDFPQNSWRFGGKMVKKISKEPADIGCKCGLWDLVLKEIKKKRLKKKK
jgi:hypothetical protein